MPKQRGSSRTTGSLTMWLMYIVRKDSKFYDARSTIGQYVAEHAYVKLDTSFHTNVFRGLDLGPCSSSKLETANSKIRMFSVGNRHSARVLRRCNAVVPQAQPEERHEHRIFCLVDCLHKQFGYCLWYYCISRNPATASDNPRLI